MSNSSDVTSGQQATAAQYNNLRADVLDISTGHDHTGATGHGMLMPTGRAVYGDGSDGDVTISGNTTLTRDMYYNSLTVNNGVTLFPDAYRIFVKGACVVNGTISDKGNNASGAVNGAVTTSSGPLGQGGPGGWSASSQNGVNGTGYYGRGGNGGNGGSGGGYAGGTGGVCTMTGGYHDRRDVAALFGTVYNPTGAYYASMAGGGGGGGGGNGAGGSAGAGGGGGGMIIVAAQTITIAAAGVITVKGGNGSNAVAGGNGGGGGAGGGGYIVLVYDVLTNGGSIDASAGAVGNGIGTGVAGSAGSSGLILSLKQ